MKGEDFMSHKKTRGEAYIDVVIGLFLSFFVIATGLELFNFLNAYHKITYMTEQLLRTAAMEGNTKSSAVGDRYQELIKTTGLGSGTEKGFAGTTGLFVSFDGSDIVNDPTDRDGTVQLGKTIKCTAIMKVPLNLFHPTKKELSVPITYVSSIKSEQYWKPITADEDYAQPGNGSNAGTNAAPWDGTHAPVIYANPSQVIVKINERAIVGYRVGYAADTTVTWSSANTGIAAVKTAANNFGTLGTYITGIASGQTTVFATLSNGTKAPIVVMVPGLQVDPNQLTLCVGTTSQINATVYPEGLPDKTVTYLSSNPNIAAVDTTGKVTGKNVGNCTITVTSAYGTTKTVNVTVINGDTGVTLNKSAINLTSSHTSEKLIATIIPQNVVDKTLTWSSSDPSIASVDQNGNVTRGSKRGVATITVKTKFGHTAICTVTVPATINITITPEPPATVNITIIPDS